MLRGRIVDISGILGVLIIVALDRQYPLPIWAYAIVPVLYVALIAWGSATISSQFFIPVRCQAKSPTDSIAITFDDGPLPGMTERILEILKEYKAPAAFFCIGSRVERAPQLLSRIHGEGHLIGNHSYFHGRLFDLQSSRRMADELNRTNAAVEAAIGRKPRFFRPPYGVTNPMLAKAVRKGNYITVGWNIRSFDTVIRSKEKLLHRVTKNLKAGDLVLFHDYPDVTLETLPEFLDVVKSKGLRIVRLDELLEEQPYV